MDLSDVDDFSLRVRTVTCGGGVAVGSGFAIDENLIVTNRHVVEDAAQIAVSTWDGKSIDAVQPEIGFYTDLALVEGAEPASEQWDDCPRSTQRRATRYLWLAFPKGGPSGDDHR